MSLASAAIAYAKLGLHVFPLAPRSKKTLKGSHGLHDATNDTDTISKWWSDHPEANIGLNAGASGMAILDADLYKPGAEDALDDLSDEIGGLPDTWTAQTGGGGYQYFFRTQDDLKSGADCFGPGLDFKAAGGYVVLPPSVHPSGRKYAWEISSTPMNSDLAPIPPKLAAKRAKKEPQEPAERPEPADPETIALALGAIPTAVADAYDTWLEVGMALHSALGASGFTLWDRWSSKSDKYRADEMQARWDSFRGSGVTIGSLFKHAADHGWEPPAYTIKDFERDIQGWTAAGPEPGAIEPFPAMLVSEIEAQDVRYLVQDLVLAKGRGLVTGAPGSGKSYLTAEIAVSVASGEPVLGQLEVEQGPVLVFNAEDDPGTITRPRMGAIATDKGLRLQDLPLYHIDIDSLDLGDPGDMARLEATILSTGARLLILDPLRDLHDVDEDNSTAMKPILHSVRLLGETTGAVVMVVHHDKKGMSTGRRESRSRGSSALIGWRSFSISLDHMERDDAHRVTPYVKAARGIAPWAFRMDETGAIKPAELTAPGSSRDNDRAVMNSLPIGTELTRAEIEVEAGLSKQQVGRSVRNLLDMEKIEAVEQPAAGQGGRPPAKYRRAPWGIP